MEKLFDIFPIFNSLSHKDYFLTPFRSDKSFSNLEEFKSLIKESRVFVVTEPETGKGYYKPFRFNLADDSYLVYSGSKYLLDNGKSGWARVKDGNILTYSPKIKDIFDEVFPLFIDMKKYNDRVAAVTAFVKANGGITISL